MRLLLAAADDLGRTFDHRDLSEWPSGSLQVFQNLGVVRRSAGGLTASCPSCADGHVEVVEPRPAPDGATRFFIYCPVALRVEVDPESCRGWEINPDGLAALAARALALTGSAKAVAPGRLWRLGRIPWEGKTRDVVLARRMREADAASVAAHIGPGGRSIVLVPHHIPDERIWRGRTPAVVALSRVTTFDGSGLAIDGVAMAETVVEADHTAEAAGVVAIDKVGKTMVRRQVKAEIKSLLTDDALIAAYKEHGSFRKAADSLTEQTGERITKDKVKRAVDRHGGVDVVKPREDSASVSRRVASHSRDRSKKFLERR